MSRYVLLTIGYTTPTPEIMEEWTRWFGTISDRIADQVGLANGREITAAGVEELPLGEDAITGYLVVEAEDIEEATEMARSCPMITSTRVYEVKLPAE